MTTTHVRAAESAPQTELIRNAQRVGNRLPVDAVAKRWHGGFPSHLAVGHILLKPIKTSIIERIENAVEAHPQLVLPVPSFVDASSLILRSPTFS